MEESNNIEPPKVHQKRINSNLYDTERIKGPAPLPYEIRIAKKGTLRLYTQLAMDAIENHKKVLLSTSTSDA